MTDRPIIFSAPMVRALWEDRKTNTRRIVPKPWRNAEIVNLNERGASCGSYSGKFNDPNSWGYAYAEEGEDMPLALWPEMLPWAPGDRLWVRENWRIDGAGSRVSADACKPHRKIEYRADGYAPLPWAERPSIHMPRWASRMTLIVEGVKVERLQDISEADAIAEGIGQNARDGLWTWAQPGASSSGWHTPRGAFDALWTTIHGTEAWGANPWVAAIAFRVVKANIDAVAA